LEGARWEAPEHFVRLPHEAVREETVRLINDDELDSRKVRRTEEEALRSANQELRMRAIAILAKQLNAGRGAGGEAAELTEELGCKLASRENGNGEQGGLGEVVEEVK
jgi:hypothetical protein